MKLSSAASNRIRSGTRTVRRAASRQPNRCQPIQTATIGKIHIRKDQRTSIRTQRTNWSHRRYRVASEVRAARCVVWQPGVDERGDRGATNGGAKLVRRRVPHAVLHEQRRRHCVPNGRTHASMDHTHTHTHNVTHSWSEHSTRENAHKDDATNDNIVETKSNVRWPLRLSTASRNCASAARGVRRAAYLEAARWGVRNRIEFIQLLVQTISSSASVNVR